MTAPDEQLREALRTTLDRFIDPDDDTMPYPNRTGAGFTWTPAETVIDDLVAAVRPVQCQQFPITSHAYQGEGFLHPCTAKGYGTACGESEYDHAEPK